MQRTINRKWAIAFGALLAFPTAYFIFISLLKYAFGLPYFFDSARPLLVSMGINDALGFNINLLILLGPVIALVLNFFAVLKIGWCNSKEDFTVNFSIQKHWWNMLLIIFSGILLAVLVVYAIGENCKC